MPDRHPAAPRPDRAAARAHYEIHTHAGADRADSLTHAHEGPMPHGHSALGWPAPASWDAPDIEVPR